MANHSCLPNAVVQIEGREAVLIAERPISVGDEILISYIGMYSTVPPQDRRRLLTCMQ